MTILLQNGDRLLLQSGSAILVEGTGVTQQFTTLSDVDPTGLADGDVFVWDAATAKFRPATVLPADALTAAVRAAVAEALIAGAAAL